MFVGSPVSPYPEYIIFGSRFNAGSEIYNIFMRGDNFDGPTISNFSPTLYLADTAANGHTWATTAYRNGSTSYVFLNDQNAGVTAAAWNYDASFSYQLRSGAVFGWSSNATNADGAVMDTGLSRIAPVSSVPTIAIGNGTPADASGTIKAKTKAGAPVAADVPAGTWVLIRDTTNNTTQLYYNNAGTLQTIALV
jgi:hypothetical protein